MTIDFGTGLELEPILSTYLHDLSWLQRLWYCQTGKNVVASDLRWFLHVDQPQIIFWQSYVLQRCFVLRVALENKWNSNEYLQKYQTVQLKKINKLLALLGSIWRLSSVWGRARIKCSTDDESEILMNDQLSLFSSHLLFELKEHTFVGNESKATRFSIYSSHN